MMTPEKIREYRERMKNDLLLYGRIVCNDLTTDKSTCPLHKDIADAHRDRPRLLAIISPRGHAKTVTASTIATSHDIAYDRESLIIIIKRTFEQAVTDLQNIVNVIKYNPRFQAIYGRYEFMIDRQERVSIINPRTGHKTYLLARGAGQSIRGILVGGSRVSKFLLDDFEDENNTLTIEQRQKVRDWMAAQVMPSLDPKDGHILAIGTIVHYDSWLNNLWERYKEAQDKKVEYSWKVIFHQMIEDGKPIWPERFTEEYIESLQASYDELDRMDKFYQEYMNIPFNPDTSDFKRDYINYWKGTLEYSKEDGHIVNYGETPRIVDVVIGIDPSSGSGGDYTGICVLATDKENNRFLEFAERKMLKPDELKEEIFSLYIKYKPRLIILEEQSMAVIMDYWLREEMKRRNVFIPLIGEKVHTRQTKIDRLRESLQPIYASGVMHHKTHMISLEDELFTFPKSKHDDIMDSLFLASKYARKPGGKLDEFGKRIKHLKLKRDWMVL